jgi:hypothetical protein
MAAHPRQRNHLAAILLAAVMASATRQLPAQDPTTRDKAAAVEAVIYYRLLFLNDTSSFEMCALAYALRPLAPPFGFDRYALARVDTASRCTDSARMVAPRRQVPVAVSGIILGDSGATVRLSISHGEYLHLEEYVVRRGPNKWSVLNGTMDGGSVGELRSPDREAQARGELTRLPAKPR